MEQPKTLESSARRVTQNLSRRGPKNGDGWQFSQPDLFIAGRYSGPGVLGSATDETSVEDGLTSLRKAVTRQNEFADRAPHPGFGTPDAPGAQPVPFAPCGNAHELHC